MIEIRIPAGQTNLRYLFGSMGRITELKKFAATTVGPGMALSATVVVLVTPALASTNCNTTKSGVEVYRMSIETDDS